LNDIVQNWQNQGILLSIPLPPSIFWKNKGWFYKCLNFFYDISMTLPPTPPPQNKNGHFFLGGVCFFQVFFKLMGLWTKNVFWVDKGIVSRLMSGRSNHAATILTFEFSKIAKISVILSKFLHFFEKKCHFGPTGAGKIL
jgi:hypothetical protein